ncbi:MAG: prephenate dehydrogenase/arogenate dehydrogenase family protein [Opitutales bacterium]|nr:prephenate dehydrogenase/arogenate dehydrogenase family protein [Opitutales bacterium]MCH8539535.1 prephenate dehydrogenase/arogenate dehydrogenase family protein [Opitutales bacterium]
MTILGAGLLGASLGEAAKLKNLVGRVHVWARREEIREKLDAEARWCDRSFATPAEAVEGADLVVACTPVEHIVGLFGEIRGSLRKQALVTDVGSVKQQICEAGRASFSGKGIFIGSHPMAGSEKSGLENADPRLYEGRNCFLTPFADEDIGVPLTKLQNFWKGLGMRVTLTSPSEHDYIVAQISHLPHFLASALAYHLAQKPSSWDNLCGGGLKDTTRIAGGDPGMWTDIAKQNRGQILSALDEFEGSLKLLREHLHAGEAHAIKEFLKTGQTYRRRLPSTYDSD